MVSPHNRSRFETAIAPIQDFASPPVKCQLPSQQTASVAFKSTTRLPQHCGSIDEEKKIGGNLKLCPLNVCELYGNGCHNGMSNVNRTAGNSGVGDNVGRQKDVWSKLECFGG